MLNRLRKHTIAIANGSTHARIDGVTDAL